MTFDDKPQAASNSKGHVTVLFHPTTTHPPIPLHALIYVSRSSGPIDPMMLSEIEQKSQQNNHGKNITGLLLSKFGMFMQYLEGPSEAIEQVLARINADPRHHSLVVLQQGACATRLFPYWAMRSMNFQGLKPKLTRDYYNPYLIFLLSFVEETTNYPSPVTLKTNQERQEYINIVEELLRRAMVHCTDDLKALKPDSDWAESNNDRIITPLRDAQSIVRLLGSELWGFRLVDLQLQFAFSSAQAQKRPLPTPWNVRSCLEALENWCNFNGA